MKFLSIILILLYLTGCNGYNELFNYGEIEYVYPVIYTGNELENELTWSLWEMEFIEGDLKGYPEYSGFFLYYKNEECTNIYKEANKQYYYIVNRECYIDSNNDLNYLYGGGYFVGTKTFEVVDDIMTFQIEKGQNRITTFYFKKVFSINVDVIYAQSYQD